MLPAGAAGPLILQLDAHGLPATDAGLLPVAWLSFGEHSRPIPLPPAWHALLAEEGHSWAVAVRL